jgi:protein-L-isoaspartate(D-aspartate) O-methyltransferase
MQPREPSLPVPPEEADAARARLARELRQRSRALSRSVQDAFAKVPRHVFVPEVAPADAYRDEAFVIKCGPDGLPVSSSSQPAMMAIMLDQLGLQAGHRVLEIGTGSGYNAAVMATVVGPEGKVISIDIDPELVVRARASLGAAGYDAVTVMCADGGFGDPDDAPFDRIIVTAGAWDIAPAWLDQVTPGGLLVLPLSVRGIQLSVALRRVDRDDWRSVSSWRCGFVRMMGAFAGPESVIRLGTPNLVAQASDGRAVDPYALQAALAGPPAAELVLPRPGGLTEVADLDLWLTMSAAALDRVTVLAAGNWFPLAPLLPVGFLVRHAAEASRLGAAVLLPGGFADRASDGAPSRPSATIRGFGPGGPALAGHLLGLARRWAELGRPGTQDVQITVRPADPGSSGTARPDGPLVLQRPSVSIEVDWPATQGQAWRADPVGTGGE